MTDEQLAYRYRKGEPGVYGIPARDITVAQFERMTADQRRKVKALAAYEAVEAPEIKDPLRSLDNEAYAALAPAEKAARTREAKRLAEAGDQEPQGTQEGDN